MITDISDDTDKKSQDRRWSLITQMKRSQNHRLSQMTQITQMNNVTGKYYLRYPFICVICDADYFRNQQSKGDNP